VDRSVFRIDGNAATLRLSRATLSLIVIVTEPDISPPQHPDFFHARGRTVFVCRAEIS
jgi:Asp-tRNA(Asn)/Glu-tRNA(Gln) amidotransferase B subunit